MTKINFKNKFTKQFRKYLKRRGNNISREPFDEKRIEELFKTFVEGNFISIKEFIKHIEDALQISKIGV